MPSNQVVIPVDLQFDADKLIDVYKKVEYLVNSADKQLSITSINGNDIVGGTGLIEKLAAPECDYNKLNDIFKGTYLEEVHNTLVEKFNVIRGRYMTLMGRKCYSYHEDPTWRLHIPLITFPTCIFLIEDKVYRLHNVGQVYLVNTTLTHSAMNMTLNDRIHIVYGMKDYNPDAN